MIYDDKKFIGNIIRNARKKAHLTQEELSEKVDMTDKNLGNIENGKQFPQLNNFFRLLEVLNIGIEDFGVNSKAVLDNEKVKLLSKIYSADSEVIKTYNLIIDAIDKVILSKK